MKLNRVVYALLLLIAAISIYLFFNTRVVVLKKPYLIQFFGVRQWQAI